MEEAKKMKCYKRLIYKQFVQVSGLCGPQFLSYLPKRFTHFVDLCRETPYWCTVLVHQYGRRKWLEEPRGVDIIERREFYTQMNHMIICREDEMEIRKKWSTNTISFQTLIHFASLFSLSEKEGREEENWCRLSRILSCLSLQSRRS